MPKVRLEFEVPESTLGKLIPAIGLYAEIESELGVVGVTNCGEGVLHPSTEGYNAKIYVVSEDNR